MEGEKLLRYKPLTKAIFFCCVLLISFNISSEDDRYVAKLEIMRHKMVNFQFGRRLHRAERKTLAINLSISLELCTPVRRSELAASFPAEFCSEAWRASTSCSRARRSCRAAQPPVRENQRLQKVR